MPFQRTITVYEDIPLDEIQHSLSSEELLIAKTIQSFIEERRESIPQAKEQSWDEYLVYCYLVDDQQKNSYIALETLVLDELKGSNSEWLELEKKLAILNRGGLGLLALREESKNIEGGLSGLKQRLIERMDFISDELEEKLDDLLWYEKLKPASIDGLRYWLLYGLSASTVKTIKEHTEILESTKENQREMITLLEKDNHNKMKLTLALLRSHDKSIERQLRALCRVIIELGYDPHIVELGKSSITTKLLFEKCKKYSDSLFGRVSLSSFRTNIWSEFRQRRSSKKLNCQDE